MYYFDTILSFSFRRFLYKKSIYEIVKYVDYCETKDYICASLKTNKQI